MGCINVWQEIAPLEREEACVGRGIWCVNVRSMNNLEGRVGGLDHLWVTAPLLKCHQTGCLSYRDHLRSGSHHGCTLINKQTLD